MHVCFAGWEQGSLVHVDTTVRIKRCRTDTSRYGRVPIPAEGDTSRPASTTRPPTPRTRTGASRLVDLLLRLRSTAEGESLCWVVHSGVVEGLGGFPSSGVHGLLG